MSRHVKENHQSEQIHIRLPDVVRLLVSRHAKAQGDTITRVAAQYIVRGLLEDGLMGGGNKAAPNA